MRRAAPMKALLGCLLLLASGCGQKKQVSKVLTDAPFVVSPNVLELGTVWVGYPVARTLDVSNPNRVTASATLDIAPPFSLDRAQLDLAGGSTLQLTVTVDPRQPGPLSSSFLVGDAGVTISAEARLPLTCTPSDECHVSVFDPVQGVCADSAKAEGAHCQTPCATGSCSNGVCVLEQAACDDGNACTLDLCTSQGCRSADSSASCPAAQNPCQAPVCDPKEGCGTVAVEDGTTCGPTNCARAQICLAGQCVKRAPPLTPQCKAWELLDFIKASNLGAGDAFGRATAISADGKTLVVGAWLEDSAGNDPANNSSLESGAVYVYRRSGLDWVQVAFLKSSNSQTGDHFGVSVALSHDGKVLAVGADGEDSDSQAMPTSNRAANAGALFVFTLEANGWNQTAYLKEAQPLSGNQLGHSVTLSGDGQSVWASKSDGSFVEFVYSAGAWFQPSLGSTPSVVPATSVAVSANSSVVLACSPTLASQLWSGSSSTPLPSAANCSLSADGQIIALAGPGPGLTVFSLRSGSLTKVFTAEVGLKVALSADGQTLAASSPDDDVRMYQEGPTGWQLLRVVKPTELQPGDHFGSALSLSANGLTLIVGAPGDSRLNAQQVSPTDFNAPASGAVYVF